VGKVKVIAFTGRESDAPYGIWGAIADQLGKKEYLETITRLFGLQDKKHG